MSIAHLFRTVCSECAGSIAWVDRRAYLAQLVGVARETLAELEAFVPRRGEFWVCLDCPAAGHFA